MPHEVIPLGFEAADFAALRGGRGPTGAVRRGDGCVHLCYVGTLLPTGIETLRLLLRGLERAPARRSGRGRLRLHFFGTSNQSRLRGASRAADRARVRRRRRR